ncbi:MAG: peroxiredoxin [Gammaproteobacteria bacterium 39-13]|nr:peroxiredoxin [Gammaproteobacteria bacterium]OJV90300.1 MAG: peroxiredoxin [Gammaproteobacteria bacterium 39-13]
MKKVALNKPLPSLSFESTDSSLKNFQDLLGQNIVIYFYPKDNTPGCTQEGKNFAEQYKKFLKLNTQIIGVSRDSLTCHEKFAKKHDFNFTLIADVDEKLCNFFEVLVEKNMYGRKAIGIERSTFLIDTKGVVRQIWRKVKVDNHVNEVLEAVKAL